MYKNIRLSHTLVNQAVIHGHAYHRSPPKQIEFWATIGRIAEENPEFNYEMIKDILWSLEEVKQGSVEAYEFD